MRMVLVWLGISTSCRHQRPPEVSIPPADTDPAASGVEDPELRALLIENWAAQMARYPEWASRLGDHRYDDRVTDRSLEALASWRADLRSDVARLGALHALSEGDRLDRDLLLWSLGSEIDREVCRFELWSVSARDNALVDSHRLAEDAMIRTDEDVDQLIARLIARYRSRAKATRTEADNLALGASQGLIESRDSVVKVIAMLDAALSEPIEGSPLLSPGGQPLPEGVTDTRRAELVRVVADEVRPSLDRYREVLSQQVLPIARENDKIGLHALPEGDSCYEALVHEYTTLDLTPDALHETGLRELSSIHEEFRVLSARLLGTDAIPEIFARLRTDAALRFDSPDDIRAKAEEALRRAEAAVPRWFGRLPEARCEVDVIPDYLAPYTTIAYYDPVRADGRTYGVYFVNVSDPTSRPRHEAEVLAFHESVPGHHLQIALSHEQGQLPAFRRYNGSTAFVEGWALYTERLAHEMGLYSSEVDLLGMLSFDAWRAARLVVDTGIHAKGWTRQQAETFLLENTPLAENNVINEVDRYITTPGQALAYKVGQLEIRALRAEAEAALGERFDIRAFHDAILSGGAVPLPILRQQIASWIAAVLAEER